MVTLSGLAACAGTGRDQGNLDLSPVPTTTPIIHEVTRMVEVPVTVQVTQKVYISILAGTPHPGTPYTSPREKMAFTGTYLYEREYLPDCLLKVIHYHTAPFEEISFEIRCDRGAPSYNIGYAMGRVQVANDLAVYHRSDDYGDCSIVFQFLQGEVTVTQIGESFDCGFGHAVYVGGSYQLIDRAEPNLGCMSARGPAAESCDETID